MIDMVNIDVTWITLDDTRDWRKHHKELKKFFKRAAERAFKTSVKVVDLYAESADKMYVKVALMEDPGSTGDVEDMLMMVDEYIYKASDSDLEALAMFRHQGRIDPQTYEVETSYNPELGGQQRLFSSVRASNLKNQLIKIGSENPKLRKHLRPILDSMSRSKTSGRASRSDLGPVFNLASQLDRLDYVENAAVNDWTSVSSNPTTVSGNIMIWVDPQMGGRASRKLMAKIRKLAKKTDRFRLESIWTPRKNFPGRYRKCDDDMCFYTREDFYGETPYELNFYYTLDDAEEQDPQQRMF